MLCHRYVCDVHTFECFCCSFSNRFASGKGPSVLYVVRMKLYSLLTRTFFLAVHVSLCFTSEWIVSAAICMRTRLMTIVVERNLCM